MHFQNFLKEKELHRDKLRRTQLAFESVRKGTNLSSKWSARHWNGNSNDSLSDESNSMKERSDILVPSEESPTAQESDFSLVKDLTELRTKLSKLSISSSRLHEGRILESRNVGTSLQVCEDEHRELENHLSLSQLDEQIAQLEEEEEQVKMQLSQLRTRNLNLKQVPLVHGRSVNESQSQRNRAPSKLQGDCYEVELSNAMLRPIITELKSLCDFMRKGSHMSIVVERAAKQEREHFCVNCVVQVDFLRSSLSWFIKQGPSNKYDIHFNVPLLELAAIFCCGEKEAIAMGTEVGRVFRVHIQTGAQPLQFSTQSTEDRSKWVLGLSLLHSQLVSKNVDST